MALEMSLDHISGLIGNNPPKMLRTPLLTMRPPLHSTVPEVFHVWMYGYFISTHRLSTPVLGCLMLVNRLAFAWLSVWSTYGFLFDSNDGTAHIDSLPMYAK